MSTTDVTVFEGVSDIPRPESWDELYVMCQRMYVQAGEPLEETHGWLDKHPSSPWPRDAAPRNGTLEQRVGALPREGLISLLRFLADLADERVPYGSDLV